MSDAKVDLTLEETLTALYKLANVGASRSLNGLFLGVKMGL
jgi:hypothetical protein